MKIQMKVLNKKFYGHRQGRHSINDPIDQDYEERMPSYATPGSAAIDLVCTEDVTIYPGERVMIGTGLAIWIGSPLNKQFGFLSPGANRGESFHLIEYVSIAGFILPRSGLGHRQGLILGNTVGLIDEDYQGELKVSVWNSNSDSYEHTRKPNLQIITLKAGDRFAQLYFAPIIKAQFDIVEEFTEQTDRNEGGWGSTGK